MAQNIWDNIRKKKKGMLIQRKVQVFQQENTGDRETKTVQKQETNYKKNFEVCLRH